MFAAPPLDVGPAPGWGPRVGVSHGRRLPKTLWSRGGNKDTQIFSVMWKRREDLLYIEFQVFFHVILYHEYLLRSLFVFSRALCLLIELNGIATVYGNFRSIGTAPGLLL